MKLINTIKSLMEEAENDYYEASKKPISEKELSKLEKNLIDTQKLVSRFNKLKGK
jgi:hypothetical protein